MASSAPAVAREDYKKQRELDELRKSGAIAAERDEDGKAINPHIPEYMAKAPWYLNANAKSGLKHQKDYRKGGAGGADGDAWYARGAKAGPAAKKFRKGACENCGAMSHKTKDCVERPRKLGARHTGQDIKADEVIVKVDLDFDAKRDRWNGYDTSEHVRLMAEHEKVDQERRVAQQKKKDDAAAADDADDFDKIREEEDGGDAKFVSSSSSNTGKTKSSVRNLRIREDTAKYLRNLDTDSAFYDPKSRSMRENPYGPDGDVDKDYGGDNFVRAGGDTNKFNDLQFFSFDAYEKGKDVHMQALPTQAQLLNDQFKKKKAALVDKKKGSLTDKYGGQEHMKSLPAELIFAQTEEYTEYGRDGKLLKGRERSTVKSRYEEDVMLNNHSSVWGSWFDLETFQWGYACSHQTQKSSWGTGEEGKKAMKAIREEMQQSLTAGGGESSPTAAQPKSAPAPVPVMGLMGAIRPGNATEGAEEDDDAQRSDRRTKGGGGSAGGDEKKRKYNSFSEVEAVTEEDYETYLKSKATKDDPLFNMDPKDMV